MADCIALFGMQKYDTFPVDVWVKRVMEEFYVEDNLSLPKIRKFALDKFGDLAGFAQQYLFYYARELGILKEKDVNFTGADVRNGMTAVVSIKHPDPRFEGQTKTKLDNQDAA